MGAPVLDHDDKRSPTWIKLRKYLEEELQALRRHNDKDRTDVQTAWTRGEIDRIKKIQSLGDEPKKEVITPEE